MKQGAFTLRIWMIYSKIRSGSGRRQAVSFPGLPPSNKGVFIPCGGGLLRAGRPCFFVPRHPCNLEHIPVSCSHNTKRMEEKEMRFLLKLLFAPVMAVLAVVSWFLVFVVGLSSGILCIPAAILGFFGLFILFVDSVSYGVGLLVIAFLISPYGLPMLAGWLVAKLHVLRYMLRDWIYG